jgi:hypothetical protein
MLLECCLPLSSVCSRSACPLDRILMERLSDRVQEGDRLCSLDLVYKHYYKTGKVR